MASWRSAWLTFLSLSLSCLILRSLPVRAAASLELYGTFHAMGVIVTLDATDDPDGDATAAIEYRTGSAPYRAGFPLSRVDDTHFVGSLFWLEPGTDYDVRVTFSDPDGDPLDGVVVMSTGSTRSEITISLAGQSYYVAPNGSGTDCSLSTPCSLTEGLNQAQPGDEVVLRGGIYYESELCLPRSGASAAPIVIRGYEGEEATLDGADPQTFIWTHQGDGVYQTTINVPDPYLVATDGQRLYPYDSLSNLQDLSPWNLPGFYADGTALYVHLADDADPNTVPTAVSREDYSFYVNRDLIVFQDLTFRHYGRVAYAKAIFLDNVSDVVVQGCTFTLNNTTTAVTSRRHLPVCLAPAGLPNPAARLRIWQSAASERGVGAPSAVVVLRLTTKTAAGDYQLSASSELIDAGVVIPGINDQGPHCYQDAAPDIGAYEWLRGDVDNDDDVDTRDIQAIAVAWRDNPANPSYDLDGNEVTTVRDVMLAAVQWGLPCQ